MFSLLYGSTFTFIHVAAAAAAAKSLQSCLTLCDPIDGSPPGPPVPGILQARILEWVAISFSNAWKWKMKVKSLSHVQLFMTPWTAAHQAPLSMGFSKHVHTWLRAKLNTVLTEGYSVSYVRHQPETKTTVPTKTEWTEEKISQSQS